MVKDKSVDCLQLGGNLLNSRREKHRSLEQLTAPKQMCAADSGCHSRRSTLARAVRWEFQGQSCFTKGKTKHTYSKLRYQNQKRNILFFVICWG
jgi:hypothetical protein